MKRQAIAVLIGSLFALPAFANYEIDPGYAPAAAVSAKSRDQVYAELVAAQRAGDVIENAELGAVTWHAAPAMQAGKSRDDVRAEVEQAFRSGDYIVNAELGDTGSHL